MDRIIKELEEETDARPLVLAYADNIAVVTDSWEDLQYEMENWNNVLNRHKMQMNVAKTEVMQVSRVQEGEVVLEGRQLKQVEHFKYLGVEFCEDNQQEF